MTGTTETDADLTDAELVERFAAAGAAAVDRDNRHFYRGWLHRELLLNRCAACGRRHHPPRPMCPSCWSWDVVPTAVGGRGTVHLLIRLHQGPSAPGVDYAAVPHPVAVVELEEQEGLRVTSTVVDCPPERLEIGLPVELAWIDRGGIPFPAFRPRHDAAPR